MTALEIASLGTLSLLTPDPAGIFLKIRDDYSAARAAGRSIPDALDDVWQLLRPDVEALVQIVGQIELPSLLVMHHGRGLMEGAFQWLAGQYSNLLQRRLHNPLFDLQPFAHNRLDHRELSHLLRTLLPCDVIVERAGDLHNVERDVLITFGLPGLTTHGYRLSDILRTLEAQGDFVLSHLGLDAFNLSSDVENDWGSLPDEEVNCCPFYTACGLDLRRAQSGVCFRQPWRIFDAARPNCWYGTAVMCTLGSVQVNNVIRDPRELQAEHRRILDAVKRRAYEIWEEREREEINDWAHWYQARQELGIPDDYHV